jgi:predicted DCC family thiol-disulfide oxidoreductase YuxK
LCCPSKLDKNTGLSTVIGMSVASPEKSIPNALPTPGDRPDADIVIFDGNCRICTAQIRKLAWWDCQGKLAYLSLHDPDVARRFPDLTYDMLMAQMYVVDRQGRRYGGAAAIRYLSRRLRRLWWLAPVLHFPGSLPVWQWLYQQVAKRRYRFGTVTECDGDACRLHSH